MFAVIEPSDKHYYQPGWTMMGAGRFDKTETCKNMIAVWPNGVKRIQKEVVSFDQEKNNVNLKDGTSVGYN